MIKDYTPKSPKERVFYEIFSDKLCLITTDLKTIINGIVFYNIKDFEITKDGDIVYTSGDDFKDIDKKNISEHEKTLLYMIHTLDTYNNVSNNIQ